MKIALLSNINADYVLQTLSKKFEMVPPVGYGNVWNQLLDKSSSLNLANPEVIVFLIDIEQLTDGCFNFEDMKKVIDEWFAVFDSLIQHGKDYFVSDVTFRSSFLLSNDFTLEDDVQEYWLHVLKEKINDNTNVHLLKLNDIINRVGKKHIFSDKLWYMGKIPYSNEGTKFIATIIDNTISLLNKTPKKVLILDLDNTLWGGVLGEKGVEGIELSDDHVGAIFKKIQQQIKMIKQTGILLAIASKNNEIDVQEVWDRHPYMVLRRDDFISLKIDWNDKADNIQQIAKELNLGIDSFVFIDDMAPERDNIRLRLPGVVVPGFPEKIEDYPYFIENVYKECFQRIRITAEDQVKTQQYVENALREEASKGLSFEEFLISLQLKVEKVKLDDVKLERIAQMHGKTNQFNLTTKRYTRQDIDRMLHNGYKVYAYNVRDKFGDYGLVAVAIVDSKQVEIDSFLMSCRIMGKLVENYVIDQIENELVAAGCKKLYARYRPTAKNIPVAKLYDGLGYTIIKQNDKETLYEIDLANKPKRNFYVNMSGGK